MSQAEDTDTDGQAEEAAETAPEAPPKRKKKLLLFALAGLLLLGSAGGGAWYFLSAPAEDKVAEAPPEAFVDVPPMQVLLRSSDGTSRMLKLHVMLVPGTLSVEELTARLPMVIDRYQPFVRELRPEDLSGSAATFRVKEELLIRSNQVLGAGSVRDVLIQDLIQS